MFLLRPDKKTNDIIAYCLAEAVRRSGIQLLAWVMMSNHYHAVVYDHDGRLPVFLEHLHKMLARCLNRRWKRWENLWSTEQTCVTYLPTLDAIFDKIVYVLANPIADHLVDRLVDWPGLSSLQYMDGRETVHERPKEFFREDGPMPETVTLQASPPPFLGDESWADFVERVREAVDAIEGAARQERLEKGSRVVGRKAILRASAFDAPMVAESRRNLRPRVACRDKERRVAELAALKEFHREYHDARASFIAGNHRTVFPAGTYQLRMWGVCCAPVPIAA